MITVTVLTLIHFKVKMNEVRCFLLVSYLNSFTHFLVFRLLKKHENKRSKLVNTLLHIHQYTFYIFYFSLKAPFLEDLRVGFHEVV